MNTVRIVGWNPGLNKVELTKVIRKHTGYGLAEAKKCTDDVLENHQVMFENLDKTIAEVFFKDLIKLGVLVEIDGN